MDATHARTTMEGTFARLVLSLLAWALVGLASPAAWAHAPNVATYELGRIGGVWTLDVHLATAGMHEALKQRHPERALSELEPRAYEALLVAAIEQGTAIELEGVPVRLGEGGVRLGAHQTDLRFVLEGAPAEVTRVRARIDALSERGGQHNVLRAPGAPPKTSRHVVLREDNDFSAELCLVSAPEPDAAATVMGSDPGATSRSAATPPIRLESDDRRRALVLWSIALFGLGFGLWSLWFARASAQGGVSDSSIR